MATAIKNGVIKFTESPNTLPGGFSRITSILHSKQTQIANDLAASLRAIASIARVEGLLKKTHEGGTPNPDLRSGIR